METTIVSSSIYIYIYKDYIGIMENNMETTTIFCYRLQRTWPDECGGLAALHRKGRLNVPQNGQHSAFGRAYPINLATTCLVDAARAASSRKADMMAAIWPHGGCRLAVRPRKRSCCGRKLV